MPMRGDDRKAERRPTTPGAGSGSMLALAAGIVVAGLPHAAAAYVGPGAGLTMLGALWAGRDFSVPVVVATFMSFSAGR